ncbi:MAG TPA: aspartate-semialdehyde dehydrogenase [Gammaproteobacteria bacterium]|nr:aspartate-semialdehyde dehydrogenase [Gammaproteobacteria bacterium]
MKQYNIAIVGATGAVGKIFIELLQSRKFPVKNLYPLGSERSAGETVMYNNRPVIVGNAEEFDFTQADIAFFSAGASVSEHYAAKVRAAGCVMIDNTSAFRYDDEVPLVVPEVNKEAIKDYKKKYIIANPNCSTAQMVVVLKPIHDAVGITRVNVATYQSVSGSGSEAISELIDQVALLLNGRPVKPQVYAKQIAFNLLPHIDDFQENGYTKEEMKMAWETQKIFNDPNIKVNATAVRVPVIYGHSEAVHLETKQKITAEQVRKLLKATPGVKVMDQQKPGGYPTPIEASGQDDVFVGRIREDISHPTGINLWIVADNLRKGAALNSIQIAEVLIEQYI